MLVSLWVILIVPGYIGLLTPLPMTPLTQLSLTGLPVAVSPLCVRRAALHEA